MNLLKTLETFKIKESHVNGIMAELHDALQEGTAEHFIEWHNSNAIPDRQISPDWYKQYLKECGDGK